jgi:hypothetical protein
LSGARRRRACFDGKFLVNPFGVLLHGAPTDAAQNADLDVRLAFRYPM